eukprot:2737919-Amphidinium_carterae.1
MLQQSERLPRPNGILLLASPILPANHCSQALSSSLRSTGTPTSRPSDPVRTVCSCMPPTSPLLWHSVAKPLLSRIGWVQRLPKGIGILQKQKDSCGHIAAVLVDTCGLLCAYWHNTGMRANLVGQHLA